MNFNETLNLHLESIDKRDLETLMTTVNSNEIILILPNGAIRHGKEYEEVHREWFTHNTWTIENKIIKIDETDKMAYVLIDVVYKDIKEGKPYTLTYYLNLVFKKCAGNWLLVFDQDTIHSM